MLSMANKITLPDISQRLLNVMDEIGVTAYRFSKDVPEVSQASLTHIKKGRNEPSRKMLELFLEKYDSVNPAWLYTGEGPMLKKQEAKPLENFEFVMIPHVPVTARAGYLSGFGDDEYIESLPTIPVIVDKQYNGKYRVFDVDGDSMDNGTRLSLYDKDKVLCREIKKDLWQYKLHINDWFFVIVHKEEGVIVKQITEHNVDTCEITCHSLNPLFKDFTINLDDVLELYNVIKIVDRNTRI